MNRIACDVLLISFLCLFAFVSNGQPSLSDSGSNSLSYYPQLQFYFEQIGENAHIFNGSEYIREGRKTNGFPFFASNDLLSGSISYEGVIYPHIGIQYDLAKDQLITPNFRHTTLIALSMEKVDSFSVEGHHFVRLDSASIKAAPPDAGYYERLVTRGGLALYEKKTKKLNTTARYEEPTYVEYSIYYLSKADGFYAIAGKNELLDLLADKKDELKKFIRSGKLNFKKRPEEAITRTVEYYSLLNLRP